LEGSWQSEIGSTTTCTAPPAAQRCSWMQRSCSAFP